MKKNLLSLALILSAGIYTYAQDTYINDAVTVKVNPNTLFFHGGNVSITNTSGDTKKIINDGNIQIKGNFTNTSTSGKNFVNTYTAPGTNVNLNYGQLIIKGDKTVNGKISIERSVPNAANDYYGFGLPFNSSEKIQNVINDMLGTENSYIGTCRIGEYCSGRFTETMLLWDPYTLRYDPVPIGQDVKPGGNYTIKLGLENLQTFIRSLNTNNQNLTLFGTPNNQSLTQDKVKSIITNYASNESGFSNITWGNWKNLRNVYNETYQSYLGNGISSADNNNLFGKNLHRFSNPFTSNIDLSLIGRGESWITFNILDNSSIRSNLPSQANPTINEDLTIKVYPTDVYKLLRFKVSKLPSNFIVNWNHWTGGTNVLDQSTTLNQDFRISAYLQTTDSGSTPFFWAGSPEALIIQPFEYFDIDYYTMAGSILGSRIISANYNITDTNKTFKTEFLTPNIGGSNAGNEAGVYARNISELLNNDELQQRGLTGPNDFTQLEFYLTKNNQIQDEAAFLVNGNFYSTGNGSAASTLNNNLFLYEELANGTINRNSETLLNQFKNDYVGKPLGIGFKNLTNGEQYIVKLRLFEYSILNRVNNFNNGTYYLHDKNTNQISEINGNSEIAFVADENINNRFELYWNEVPRTLGTDNLSTTKATYVYKNENNHFVRFEDNNTKATVKIFDLNGRLISTHPNINTNEDLKLNIAKGSAVYIINIEYDNGTTVSKKIIQN